MKFINLKQEALTIFIRFFSIFTGLFTSVLTARYLGPEGRGDYFFITTLVLLLTQISTLGLSSSNTYFVSKDEGLLNKLIANSLWLSIFIGGGSAFITVNYFYFIGSDSPSDLYVTLFLVPTSIFYLLGTNLLVGINKLKEYNYFQFLSNIMVALFIFFASLMKCSVSGFLWSSAIGWLFSTCALLWYLKNQTTLSVFSFDKSSFCMSLPYGLKAYFVTLMGMLVLRGNVFLLKFFATEEMLGYYSIAAQLTDAISIIPSSIGLILFPSLVRNVNNRKKELNSKLGLIIIIMIIVCFLSAILVTPFVKFVFGVQFISAATIFLYLLPSTFFLGVIVILSQYLAAEGFPKILILFWMFTLVIMVITSVILIPDLQGKGAALSLSISYGVLLVCICFLIYKTKKKEF